MTGLRPLSSLQRRRAGLDLTRARGLSSVALVIRSGRTRGKHLRSSVGKTPHRAWPWMVSLQIFTYHNNRRYHVCGGSLLDSQWLAHDAHCFQDPKYVRGTREGVCGRALLRTGLLQGSQCQGSLRLGLVATRPWGWPGPAEDMGLSEGHGHQLVCSQRDLATLCPQKVTDWRLIFGAKEVEWGPISQ